MPGLVFLFPLDGSEQSYQALSRATRYLAQIPGSLARLLVVSDVGFDTIAAETREGIELRIERQDVHPEVTEAQEVAARGAAVCARSGIAHETRVRRGKPYDVILEECHLADVLVMHSLEPHRTTELLRGSMTERILRHARCHVLLMHPAPARVPGPEEHGWRPIGPAGASPPGAA